MGNNFAICLTFKNMTVSWLSSLLILDNFQLCRYEQQRYQMLQEKCGCALLSLTPP